MKDVRDLCKCSCRLMLIASAFVLAIPTLATDASDKESWSELMLSAKQPSTATSESTNWFRAIRVAEKFGENDPRLHIALYNAAVAYSHYNSIWSEALFKRDIVNLERISADFPDIVSDCFQLANLYIWTGNFNKPEPLLYRGISIRKKWKDVQSKDPFNAEIYSSLYMLYYLEGLNEKAERANEDMLKSLSGWRTYKTRAECLWGLGSNFRQCVDMSKNLSAEQRNHLLTISLQMTEQAAACYKAGKHYQFEYAFRILEVARINEELGNSMQAEKRSRESLRLADENFGSLNRVAFGSVQVLMQVLAPKRCVEAQKLLDDYLSRVKQLHGPTSKQYLDDLNRSAAAWESAKCFDLAAEKRKEARALYEKLKLH